MYHYSSIFLLFYYIKLFIYKTFKGLLPFQVTASLLEKAVKATNRHVRGFIGGA